MDYTITNLFNFVNFFCNFVRIIFHEFLIAKVRQPPIIYWESFGFKAFPHPDLL